MESRKAGEHQFLWRIVNFSASISLRGMQLVSPVIVAEILYQTDWCVVLKRDDDTNFLNAFLLRNNRGNGPTHIFIDFEFYIVDRCGNERFKQRRVKGRFNQHTVLGTHEFVRMDDIYRDRDALLPNDVLTLVCRAWKSVPIQLSITRSFVRTELEVVRMSFEWTIQGLDPMDMTRKGVVEVRSKADVYDFVLICRYFNAIERDSGQYVVRFTLQPKMVFNVKVFMVLSIQIRDGTSKESLGNVSAERYFEPGSDEPWKIKNWVLDSIHMDVDKFEFTCDVAISEGKVAQTSALSLNTVEQCPPTLKVDLRSLYKCDGNWCVKLIIGSVSVKAHKLILSSRSPVFCKLLKDIDRKRKLRWFQPPCTCLANSISDCRCDRIEMDANDTASKCVKVKQDCITIILSGLLDIPVCFVSNVGEKSFLQMLLCMYTDEFKPVSVENAIALYHVGGTFQFKLIQVQSLQYLMSRISWITVFTILVFANSIVDLGLMRSCFDYISENRGFLLVSSEWKGLLNSHEELAKKVIDVMQSKDVIL